MTRDNEVKNQYQPALNAEKEIVGLLADIEQAEALRCVYFGPRVRTDGAEPIE